MGFHSSILLNVHCWIKYQKPILLGFICSSWFPYEFESIVGFPGFGWCSFLSWCYQSSQRKQCTEATTDTRRRVGWFQQGKNTITIITIATISFVRNARKARNYQSGVKKRLVSACAATVRFFASWLVCSNVAFKFELVKANPNSESTAPDLLNHCEPYVHR